MIKALAIDDEPLALNILKKFCDITEKITLSASFTSTKSARDYLQNNTIDLLFLDINMPAITGLEFYEALNDKMMVIFTTAYAEFALEGFNLNAIDYLLKPISYERFLQGVDKALEYQQIQMAKKADSILIKSGLSMIKIVLNDILFIEAYSDYLKIHRKYEKVVVTRMTMNEMLSLLSDYFVRVHRSYIVSVNQIKEIKSREIIIETNTIPIGKTYLRKLDSIRQLINKRKL